MEKFGLIVVTKETLVATDVYSIHFSVGTKNYRALIATLTDKPHVYNVVERKAGKARQMRYDSKLLAHIVSCLPHNVSILVKE